MLSSFSKLISGLESWQRLLLVISVAVICHILVLLIRSTSTNWLELSSQNKRRKVSSLITLISSSLVFSFYFAAIGVVLTEFGVPIGTYIASASIIGLAVGFGSQGMVQDVVSGLTTIFSNVFDVGDMVEISGQVGIVRFIGLRFLEIENSYGAKVLIPNRSVTNVINYRRGYIRCIVDVTIPKTEDETVSALSIQRIIALSKGVHEQFPGILLTLPSIEGEKQTTAGRKFLRIKFRIWPGRGAPIEDSFKKEIVQEMKAIDTEYQDWMVAVYYEVETKSAPAKGSKNANAEKKK